MQFRFEQLADDIAKVAASLKNSVLDLVHERRPAIE